MQTTAILNFHGLGEPPAFVEADERPYWASVSAFEAIVAMAAKAPRARVGITFDDGNTSDLAIAAPRLAAAGLSATFFVCTDRLGAEGYLNEADLRALVGFGMEVGSHGEAHVRWTGLERSAVRGIVSRSLAKLSDVCGRPVRTVAIPFGAYDRTVLAALRDAGVERAFSSDGGLALTGAMLQPRLSYRIDRPQTAYSGLIDAAGEPAGMLKAHAKALTRRLLKGC